jgi:hypothetical protein
VETRTRLGKGKAETARGHHTGAGGTQAPRRGQKESRGVLEENLSLERSPNDARKTPRRKTKKSKRRLILNCTYQKTSRLRPRRCRCYRLQAHQAMSLGIPPLIGKLHLRDPLDLMNMWQRSWILNELATHHGEERQEPTAKPSNRIRREQGRCPRPTAKQIPGSGTGHGNTAAARGTPAQAPEAQRAPKDKTKRLMHA